MALILGAMFMILLLGGTAAFAGHVYREVKASGAFQGTPSGARGATQRGRITARRAPQSARRIGRQAPHTIRHILAGAVADDWVAKRAHKRENGTAQAPLRQRLWAHVVGARVTTPPDPAAPSAPDSTSNRRHTGGTMPDDKDKDPGGVLAPHEPAPGDAYTDVHGRRHPGAEHGDGYPGLTPAGGGSGSGGYAGLGGPGTYQPPPGPPDPNARPKGTPPMTTPVNGSGSGVAADFFSALNALTAQARAGGIRSKARVNLVMGEGFGQQAIVLDQHARDLQETGLYPATVWEPVIQAANMIRAAASKMTESGQAIATIANTPAGELQGRAPHREELNKA